MAETASATNGSAEPSPAPLSSRPVTVQALSPEKEGKAFVFNPAIWRMSKEISKRDPLFAALQFKWADFQQHGRLIYDTMYKHPAVSAPFESLLLFLKSYRPMFKAAGSNPTDLQKQLADFANEQLRRLGSTGDPRQGYEKLIDWIGQGLKYGFSIAEMETVFAPWGGQRRIQINRILPLPQATLDSGLTILEEFGGGITSPGDPRYRCFILDEHGVTTSIRQFASGYGQSSQDYIEWTGAEMLRILHFSHGATEGNPYGRSIFFGAFYAWADLYTLEQMEAAFLDSSLPYIGISYATKDGRPSPELHKQMIELLTSPGSGARALIGPDMTFSSVAPSNPSFTEHSAKKKDELRSYIFNAILGIPVMNTSVGNELDARNAIQVFFKYLVPGLQREVSTLLTWQFARRLIDTNWSGLNDTDYPELVFQNTLDNDLRVALPLIQMLFPYLDSEQMPTAMEALIPGMDKDWFPADHNDSVAKTRQPPDPAAGSKPPPTKAPGTNDTQYTGDKASVGQRTETSV